MSDTPEQEPSIEEILSSIRQIISDDDEEAVVEEAPQAAAPAPEPAPADPVDDAIELTDVIHESAPEPEPVIEVDLLDSEPEPTPVSTPVDSIMTDNAASATLQGFSSLVGNMAVDRGTHPGGVTIEDIVRELMNPMLREWIDQNLPPMIEKLVKAELERLANKAMDK